MKRLIFKGLILLKMSISMTSLQSNAQTYDIYIDNRVLTSVNSMEFDVYIRSNGNTGSWPLRTFQTGYNLNPAFVNGGTLTANYVQGTSELESTYGKNWGFTWNASANVLNQSANTGSACPGAIIGDSARKIGRFRVVNSVYWGCANDSLKFKTSGTGHLILAITKYNSLDCSVLGGVTVTAGANPFVTNQAEIELAASVNEASTVRCGDSTEVTISAFGGVGPYVGTGVYFRKVGQWEENVMDARGCVSTTMSIVSLSPGPRKFTFNTKWNDSALNNNYSWSDVRNWDCYPGLYINDGDTIVISDSSICNVFETVVFSNNTLLQTNNHTQIRFHSSPVVNGTKFHISKDVDINSTCWFDAMPIGKFQIINKGFIVSQNALKECDTVINYGQFWIQNAAYYENWGVFINYYDGQFMSIDNMGTFINYGTFEVPEFKNIGIDTSILYENGIEFGQWQFNFYMPSVNSFDTVRLASLYATYDTCSTCKRYGRFVNFGNFNSYDFKNINYFDDSSFTNYSKVFIGSRLHSFQKIINYDTLIIGSYGKFSNFFWDTLFLGGITLLEAGAEMYNFGGGNAYFNKGAFVSSGKISLDYYSGINNQGKFINNGEIIKTTNSEFARISNDYKLENSGSIYCDLFNYGSLVNLQSGSFSIPTYMYNMNSMAGDTSIESVINYGVLQTDSTAFYYDDTWSLYPGRPSVIFRNYGTVNNSGEWRPSCLINNGIFNNYGEVNLQFDYSYLPALQREIKNFQIVNNYGTFSGNGFLLNISGGLVLNNGIVSPGSTTSVPQIFFESSATQSNSENEKNIVRSSSASSFQAPNYGCLFLPKSYGRPDYLFEITDTLKCDAYDFVSISDTFFGGRRIDIVTVYTPDLGQEFTLIQSDTVIGSFDSVFLPQGWQLLYNYPLKGDVTAKYVGNTIVGVKAFIQGYYDGAGLMRPALMNSGISDANALQADSIQIEVRHPLDGSLLAESMKSVLNTHGEAFVNFPKLIDSGYLVLKHRNALETWSSTPVVFNDSVYINFTSSSTSAYGNNLIEMEPGQFAIYSGDLNQDGIIESEDYLMMENDLIAVLFGYHLSDLTGDGAVESEDYLLLENNLPRVIFSQKPF